MDKYLSDLFLSRLDTIIANQNRLYKETVKMAGELDALKAQVIAIKGSTDSIVALVNGLSQFIKDNVDDPAALLDMAAQLDADNKEIADAVNANPLPTPPGPPAPAA